MKKAMIFGTFDIFHEGHKDFFRQAREYGDYLVVVVARDENVMKVKNKLPRNNEKERLNKIKESGLAEEVVLGDLVDKYKAIKKYKPEAICLGYDQKVFVSELKNKLAEFGLDKTRIIRLKSFHPEIYKSSKIGK
jgi:FAD synthetase